MLNIKKLTKAEIEECDRAYEIGLNELENMTDSLSEQLIKEDDRLDVAFLATFQGLLEHVLYFYSKEDLKEMIDDAEGPEAGDHVCDDCKNKMH